MKRRGFALLTVLWLIAVLSFIAGTTLAVARAGSETSRNRITLARAEWARDACIAIFRARLARDRAVRSVDTTEIGRGAWCRVTSSDQEDRLDLNAADDIVLHRLLGDSLADALLDWRDADDDPRRFGAESGWYREQNRRPPRNGPLADLGELRYVRGFDASRVADLQSLLSVSGSDRINLNAAPEALLAVLPGMSAEALTVIRQRRERGTVLGSLDELAGLLSPPARVRLQEQKEALLAQTSFATSRLRVAGEGGVRGSKLVARAELVVALDGIRPAVVRSAVE